MTLFGKKKSPQELVEKAKDALTGILSCTTNGESHLGEEAAKKCRKYQEDAAKYLGYLRQVLYGDNEHRPSQEAIEGLTGAAASLHLAPKLVTAIPHLGFEARKDASQVFSGIVRTKVKDRYLVAESILAERGGNMLTDLINGYESIEFALNYGVMLRECVRVPSLARHLLETGHLYKFFSYVELSTFDVSSDAFATFKELLTRHEGLVKEFLTANFDEFFGGYNKLLKSGTYVTQRQSLKLLGEILLNPLNVAVMLKYISDPSNLMLMMDLLRDDHKSIQYEAFHVFKVFVVNPDKTAPVHDILFKNRDKLLTFFANFQNDREDEQFIKEKSIVSAEISKLESRAQ